MRFLSFVWTMVNLENVVYACNVPEIKNIVRKVVVRKATPAYELLGYFNLLDGAEELTEDILKELADLLKKHRNPFMSNVLSLRTQHYMNTHASKVHVEQKTCSMLKVKYVHRAGRG